MPIGNTYKYETTGYVIQGGGGRNFNKTLGVLAQFDYDHFGLQGSTINNESTLYLGATGQGFGGNNHVWSFSLNPTFTLPTEGSLGAYAVLGVGFYHKVTNFTLPGTACADPYCYYIVTVNQTCGAICHYSSNAPGFSGPISPPDTASHAPRPRSLCPSAQTAPAAGSAAPCTSTQTQTAPETAP
jgi:hypothetical protein